MNTNPFNTESVIIKQSPIVIIKNFILFELVAVAAFFVAGALVHFAAIYRTSFLSQTVSFHLAEISFIYLVQTILVLYIFLRWYKNYYDLRRDSIAHGWGIWFKHREVIPLQSFHRVSIHQGPLAKVLKYGTLTLTGQHPAKLLHIPEPEKYADLIMQFKKSNSTHNTSEPTDVQQLISQPEHENLEFKSSFRWDHKENKVNRGLERAVMKTVAAFLNSHGGRLVIGVDDKKNIVGVDHDYKTLPRPDADSFENHFSQVFHSMIGPEFRQFVRLSCHAVGDKEVCMISVSPSRKPVYLKTDGGEEFYVRTGNKTTSLRFSEANSYLESRKFV